MNTASLHSEIDALPLELKKEVQDFIAKLKTDREKKIKAPQKLKQREFGALKGKIRISDDFDEPLEDFKDYM